MQKPWSHGYILVFLPNEPIAMHVLAMLGMHMGAAPFIVRSTPDFENTNGWNRTPSHDCSELFWQHQL